MKQTKIYVLCYINVDEPSYSEVLGIYSSKESAVDNLLEVANYREKDGKLTQYMVYLTSDIYDTQKCSKARENFGAFSISAAVRYPYSTSYFYPYDRETVIPVLD